MASPGRVELSDLLSSLLLSIGALFVSQLTLLKYGQFQAEISLPCVRWYLRYSLSYRDVGDVGEMMAERGLSVDHTTIYGLQMGPALCARSGAQMSGQVEADEGPGG
jgi:hypothetical protein